MCLSLATMEAIAVTPIAAVAAATTMTAIPNAGRWRLFLDPLFITKWSSVPGEYELILTAAADFAEDHLTRQQEKQVIGRGCGSSLAHRSKQDGAHHRESQESRENASSWAPCWPFVGILRPWQVQEFIHVLAVAIYPVFPLACPSRESWRAAQHPHTGDQTKDHETDLSGPVGHG
jgi:hypothetical protein